MMPAAAPADRTLPAWRFAEIGWAYDALSPESVCTARIPITRRATVSAALARTELDLKQPLLVKLVRDDGVALFVPRAEWPVTRLRAGDRLAAVPVPAGGGGSNIGRVLAMIAVIVIATLLGGPFGTAIGLSEAAGIAILTVAGNILVNVLIPPQAPRLGDGAAEFSPTYALSGSGNNNRLGAPIPEQFGRMMHVLDLAADEYGEYSGDLLYRYTALSCGEGAFTFHELRFGDTAFWREGEGLLAPFTAAVQMEIVEPGSAPTLFSPHASPMDEVSGQALKATNEPGYGDGWVGPYVLNAAGTYARSIGVDMVCPRGLFTAGDPNTGATVSYEVQVQEIDQVTGAPVAGAAWTTVLTRSITRTQADRAVRQSEKRALDPARYRVRVRRTNARPSGNNTIDELVWAGAKAYFAPPASWPGRTVLLLKIQAGEQVSGQAASRINAIKTRKLPVRSAVDGSFTTQATRNPAWVMLYLARLAYSDAQIDMEVLQSLAATYAARGDYFDAIFDTNTTWVDALTAVTSTVRTIWLPTAKGLTFVRDEVKTLYRAALTDRNTTAKSGRTRRVYMTPATPTGIEVEYLDERTWKPNKIRSALPGVTPSQWASVRLFGVTTRAHGFREANFKAAENLYRRLFASGETELDARLLWPGDRVLRQSELADWSEAAELVDVSADGRTLTANRDLAWAASGTHQLALTTRSGGVWGPVTVTAVSGRPDQALLPASLPSGVPALIVTGAGAFVTARAKANGDRESSSLLFGPSSASSRPMLVVSIDPRDPQRTGYNLLIDDERVHGFDGLALPSEDTGPPGGGTENLTITGVSTSSDFGQTEITVTGAPDHNGFEIEVEGVSYGDYPGTPFIIFFGAGTWDAQVRAIGFYGRGPWFSFSFTGSGSSGGWGGGGWLF